MRKDRGDNMGRLRKTYLSDRTLRNFLIKTRRRYWRAILGGVGYWKKVMEVAPDLRIAHGGEAETSILLAIAPRAVRTDYMKEPDPRPRPQPPLL